MEILVFIISLIAMTLSIIGNVGVNFMKRWAFAVWTISNVFWVTVNIIGTMNIPQVMMFTIYGILNVHGFMKWRKGKDE